MLGLGQTQQPKIHVPEIMEAFGEAARLNAMMEGSYYTGAAEYQRDELILDIASKMVGRRVEVAELIIPDGAARPIMGHYQAGKKDNIRWADADPERLKAARMYEQSDFAWHHSSRLFRFRPKTRGVVDGVEAQGASLVIQPSGYRRLQRDFVTMADPTGEPLVSLIVLE